MSPMKEGISENTLRTTAQSLKTFCRFGHQRREMPDIITGQFEMPKVPEVLIPTFTDEQLKSLLGAPNPRKWVGIRDRAIMMMLFDTMARLSEITNLRERDVNLAERVIETSPFMKFCLSPVFHSNHVREK